jgi:hypothetical protein
MAVCAADTQMRPYFIAILRSVRGSPAYTARRNTRCGEAILDALLKWMLGSWHVLGIDIQIWMLAFAGIFLVYGAAHLYLEGRRQLQARRQRH